MSKREPVKVPVLSTELKKELVYELLLFAQSVDSFQGHDTGKVSIYALISVIMREGVQFSANSNMLIIKELRKRPELFQKVRAFIRNSATCCKQSYCWHDREDHVDGKCNGTRSRWVPNPNYTASDAWRRSADAGHYVEDPCACPRLKCNITW